MFDIGQSLAWFLGTWKVWLVFVIATLVGYSLYWYLFIQRSYRAINGKGEIKQGRLGKWQDLETHLYNEHNIRLNK